MHTIFRINIRPSTLFFLFDELLQSAFQGSEMQLRHYRAYDRTTAIKFLTHLCIGGLTERDYLNRLIAENLM